MLPTGAAVALTITLLLPLSASAEEATASPYAGFLDEVMARWSEPGPSSTDDELLLTCLDTPGQDRYVGARQELVIHAPLATVAAALDDIPHYPQLYADCVAVRVLEREQDGSRFRTAWERRVPLFFIPNTHFTLAHQVDRSSPDRLVYRYQLQESNRLKHSDGVTVLQAIGPDATRLVEFAFFDAHWGPLSVGLVWRAGLRGIVLGGLSVKLRAENPAWSYQQVRREAERRWSLDERLVARCRGSSRVAALP